MSRWQSHSAFVVIAGLTIGCGFGSDAATRLADDVVEHAALLRTNGQELTFTHSPRPSPEGCESGYTVELQDSLRGSGAGRSLRIGCKGDSHFRELGYSYTTTYHLNAVRVPAALSVDKQVAEALQVTLAKHGAVIDVVSVK
jgi:hypothetical protein